MTPEKLGRLEAEMACGKQGGLGRVAFFAAVFATMTASGQAPAVPTAETTRDETEAKTLFQAGKFAFESGRYEEALDRWQRSYGISGRSELLYNLGLAHDRLRHDAQAVESFEAYLAAHPDSPQETEVRGRVRALKAAHATRAPTPEETAAGAPIAQATGPGAEAKRDGPTPWYGKWWVWTIAGAVVAGVVVGVVVGTSGGGAERAEPGSGVTIEALTWGAR